jgi:16S rRNA (guanine527-N7)-methyltransferase
MQYISQNNFILLTLMVVLWLGKGLKYTFNHKVVRNNRLSTGATRSFGTKLLSTISEESPTFDIGNQLNTYVNAFPDITTQQWRQLEKLTALQLEWNQKVNLISRKDEQNLVSSHIIPCLAMSLVRKFGEGERIVDVGTGGGLPGLPMAIVNNNAHFTLLDSNGKKMMIVEDIANRLGLSNIDIVRGRAEDLDNRKFDMILGRAVSSISNFLSFSSHLLLDPTTTIPSIEMKDKDIEKKYLSGLLYLKGGNFDDELKKAGIQEFIKFPISQLIPEIVSDKFVLNIPSTEIFAFHKCYIENKLKLKAKTKS